MTINRQTLIREARERLDDLARLCAQGLVCLDGDFFPSVHYPPITMYPAISGEELLEGYSCPADGLLDVYVHIPFCIRQCTFCHYPVKLGHQAEQKQRYLRSLEREIEIYMQRLGLQSIKARSILFGGGTPTHLRPAQFQRLLRFFDARVDRSQTTQFSFDVDPPTLLGPEGARRLELMRHHGVDRLTIGAQSFTDDILRRMNRPHDAVAAADSIVVSRDSGFLLNVELIFGYPGQTMEQWLDDIETAVSLGAEEIQLYRLKVIPYGDHDGTVYTRARRRGDLEIPDVEQALWMKQAAMLLLRHHGYHENLRRVFCRDPEIYSHYAHNQCCDLLDQIGFGLTAFSSLRDRFALNTQDFDEYHELLRQGRLPVNRGMVRDAETQRRWAMVLPLKNRSVRTRDYQRITGLTPQQVFPGTIARLQHHGLIQQDPHGLGLTELGRFFADEVCHQFHHPTAIPFAAEAYADGELNPYGVDS